MPNLPAPPSGFILEGSDVPPPPPGFTVVSATPEKQSLYDIITKPVEPKSVGQTYVDSIANAVRELTTAGHPEGTFPGRQINEALATAGHPVLGATAATITDLPGIAVRGVGNIANLIGSVLGIPTAGRLANEGAQNVATAVGAPERVAGTIGTAANVATQLLAPALVNRGIGVVNKGLARTRTPESLQVEQTAKDLGVPLSAGQITGNPTISQLEAIPGRFPVGSKATTEFARRQVGATKTVAEKIGEAISPTKTENVSEAGDLFKEGYQIAKDASRAAATKAYNAVGEAIPKTELFETPGLLKSAETIANETQAAKGVIVSGSERVAGRIKAALGGDQPPPTVGGRSIESFGPDAVKAIMDQYNIGSPDRQMTFQGMEFLRQTLRSKLRAAARAGNDQDVRRIGDLIDGLTQDMRATADRFPDAAPLLEKADTLFKQEVAPYYTKGTFTRKLSDKNASQIVKTAIWGNAQQPENIALVRDALKSPEQFNTLTRAWWEDLINKSTDPRTDVFSTDRFLTNYHKFTPESRAILLGDQAPQAEKLIQVMEAMGKSRIAGANPSETARGILGAGQAMGGIKVVQDVAAGRLGAAIKEGMLLLTPAAIGKIVTSPRGINMLTNGIQLPVGSPAAVATFAQLAALGNAMNKIDRRALLKSDLPIEDKITAALADVSGKDRTAR